MKNIPFQKAKNNFTLIVFGASGSLARLKLFPSLFELVKEGRMPKDFKIVGYSRTPMTDEAFREIVKESVLKVEKNASELQIKTFLEQLSYVSGAYDSTQDYETLKKHLGRVEKTKDRIRLAYFSVPPSVFPAIFENLAATPLNTKKAKLRLIIEKPFGYDLKSAQKLKKHLEHYFDDEQIYLLDHYLGKKPSPICFHCESPTLY